MRANTYEIPIIHFEMPPMKAQQSVSSLWLSRQVSSVSSLKTWEPGLVET